MSLQEILQAVKTNPPKQTFELLTNESRRPKLNHTRQVSVSSEGRTKICETLKLNVSARHLNTSPEQTFKMSNHANAVDPNKTKNNLFLACSGKRAKIDERHKNHESGLPYACPASRTQNTEPQT